MTDEDDGFCDYDSGPFCKHWSDPSDCDELCATCGHMCCRHGYSTEECYVDDCKCEQFVDE